MRIFPTRIGAHLGVVFLVSALSVACEGDADDMGDTATDTTGDGDGDGDSGDGDGDGDSGDGDGDAALSYAADIQPIWNDNCVMGCHEPAGLAEFLDLTDPSFSNVVGTLSTQATDKQLIEAGNAANSYLIAKLRGTQTDLGGNGTSMPGGVNPVPLDEATIMMIEQWTNEGALP